MLFNWRLGSGLKNYVLATGALAHSGGAACVRSGARTALVATADGKSLGWYVSGLLPYYYREPTKIGVDFAAEHHAIEMVLALFNSAPKTPKFQNSHCGEILASDYMEKVLGYRRLYSKLTLTTAEDTNVHKMDGFFVKTDVDPFHYVFVEAKASVLPTEGSKFDGHRYGLMRRMIESIGKYDEDDQRFDLTKIRDNLQSSFDADTAKRIRADLVPPGPVNSSFMGIAVVNKATVDQQDDDYILVEACAKPFDFHAVTVDDLAALAKEAYSVGADILAVAKKGDSNV